MAESAEPFFDVKKLSKEELQTIKQDLTKQGIFLTDKGLVSCIQEVGPKIADIAKYFLEVVTSTL